MKHLYILKVGTTFEHTKVKFGDFEEWVGKPLGRYKVVHVQEGLPRIQSAKGFIITGAHCMVSDELWWSVRLEEYIRQIAKTNIPLLGICYGHQLIAKALGGVSGYNKKGKEVGLKTITKKSNDPLLKGIPKKFSAFETHYQSVIKTPKGAKVLARNSKDAHQCVRYRKNIWGVQFHPEFDKFIMDEYILENDKTKVNFRAGEQKVIKNFELIVNSL